MKKTIAWVLGMGLVMAVPVVALSVVARASASQTVQVQSALDSTGVAFRETSLGNVVADAVCQAGHADIALVAADELTETTIPAGSVATSRFVKALRYADDATDTVVVLRLTGAQMRDVAERSVSTAPRPFDGFLQVSGLAIRYDPSRPEGSRVRQVSIGGADIQADHNYRVATTRPVADGGFGYFRLWGKDAIQEDTHTSIAAALTGYLASHTTVDVQTNGRIIAQ